MTNSANTNKIFFDVSSIIEYLSHHPYYSGIQRVVAMILSEYRKLDHHEFEIWIGFIHPKTHEYLALKLSEIDDIFQSPKDFRSFFYKIGIIRNNHPDLLEKYSNNKVKYLFHRTRYDVASLFKSKKTFRKHGITAEDWKEIRCFSNSQNVSIKRINQVASSFDQLVLLDSSWQQKHVESFIAAKSMGLKIYTLIYDLIPIFVPGCTSPGIVEPFGKWLIQSMQYTDVYLTISKYTRDDLLQYLTPYRNDLIIEVLPLTQTNLPTVSKPETHILDPDYDYLPSEIKMLKGVSSLCQSILNDRFVLHVGTIEIRKNTWRLALAWKKLIEAGHSDLPRLIFAGRRGWMNERFFDLLKATGNLYGYVTVIEKVSDHEMELLYKNCLFTTMVSTYEGWGLPVGEALSYGKTAVVSSTTSLPEVGMDLVEYCDPLSVESIADAAYRLAYDHEYRQMLENRIKNTRLRNWSDVALDLQSILESI